MAEEVVEQKTEESCVQVDKPAETTEPSEPGEAKAENQAENSVVKSPSEEPVEMLEQVNEPNGESGVADEVTKEQLVAATDSSAEPETLEQRFVNTP